jgi:hypothetical protein
MNREQGFKQAFIKSPEDALDPMIPRFRLVDETTGAIVTRFALDRLYAPGEEIILPSIRVKMP